MADFTTFTAIDTFMQSASNSAARTNLGLGTAATTAAADYATAAQGALADSAQQPPVEGPFLDGDKTKLDGIAAGAEVNTIESIVEAGMLDDAAVLNVVSVSQANYDAGTPVGTTLYIIT